jgi:hypothetical protein
MSVELATARDDRLTEGVLVLLDVRCALRVLLVRLRREVTVAVASAAVGSELSEAPRFWLSAAVLVAVVLMSTSVPLNA